MSNANGLASVEERFSRGLDTLLVLDDVSHFLGRLFRTRQNMHALPMPSGSDIRI
jgi:hypothetical protein